MPLGDTGAGLRNGIFDAGADVPRDLHEALIGPDGCLTFGLPGPSDARREGRAPRPVRVLS